MQYTETQLSKLIEDVEREFSAALCKAEGGELAPLTKAEDKPFPPKKEEKESEEPKAETKPEGESKPEGEAHPPKGAPKEEAAAPTKEAAPEASHGASHDYDDEDMAHLDKMYMSMSKDELMVHHNAVKNALDKCMGMGEMGKSEPKDDAEPLNAKPHDKGDDLFPDKKDGGIEGAEPKNALGAKSPASDANGAKINKSEYDRRNGGKIEAQAPANALGAKSPASDANGAKMNKSEGTEVDLLKSELGTVKTEYETLKKNYEGVEEFLKKLLKQKPAPAAKAITSLEVIAKNEGQNEEKPLTKSEIGSALLKKSQDPSTSKADRDAINNYYLNDQVDVRAISHLLK